ncbi:cytochrome c [Paraconexibacter antarcticus]|uniref:Cytochrome c n=1 Tax=Paraconexibacter antarcticus TaxID=2949664 RepID=A0ABY5DWL6_9ACTN|nr:c-type cytochrome [Paraconexibacter antarcticus]UTI66056.1 cytochrome c [Paraconexibacter antarcticus]
MTPVRTALAALVVVAFGLAIAGAGMGGPPAGDPAPKTAAVTVAKQAIARNATAAEGAKEFESEGCDACHAIAATGAKGKLGPRLDTDSDPVRETAGNVTDPRTDIAEGYEAKLMPTDYASRMSAEEIRAVATFIHTVSAAGGGSGGKKDGDGG